MLPEARVEAVLRDQLRMRAPLDDRTFVHHQDEIGTPYCVTVDFDTLGQGEDRSLEGTVTVRDRDTMEQIRMKASELKEYFGKQMEGC